jgi:ketosteroid isomerase-like protein
MPALVGLLLVWPAAPRAADAPAGPPADPLAERGKLEIELREAETAFARTMAERDPTAFATFLSEEAIFIGSRETLRGKAAVVAGWMRFFEGEDAPFSWAPERAEVLDSGTLGLTSGPVHDPTGARIGTFKSIWRRAGGAWRIVFDKGCPPCP